VHTLWEKELKAKDINKEMFPIYGGKCLSEGLSKIEDDVQPDAEMAETISILRVS
jgi:hypothetical protein